MEDWHKTNLFQEDRLYRAYDVYHDSFLFKRKEKPKTFLMKRKNTVQTFYMAKKVSIHTPKSLCPKRFCKKILSGVRIIF